MKKRICVLLVLVLAVLSCAPGFSAFAAGGYVISGKTDSANRWSAAPDSAFITVTQNLWKAIADHTDGADAVRGLDGYLENTLYTNSNVGKVLKLYDVLESTDLDGVVMDEHSTGRYFSDAIGKYAVDNGFDLIEAKYSPAKEKILAAIAGEYPRFSGFRNLTFDNGDFGFQDGDREGFIDAVLAVLRPLVNDVGGRAFKVIYHRCFTLEGPGDGIYQYFIPVLEALGVQNVMSAEEEADRYADAIVQLAKTYDPGAYFVENSPCDSLQEGCEVDLIVTDEVLRPLVEGILEVYDREIAKNPVLGVLKVFPRVAYIVNSGLLTQALRGFADASKTVKKNSALKDYLNNYQIDAACVNASVAGKEWTIGGKTFVLAPVNFAAYAAVRNDANAAEEAFDIAVHALGRQLSKTTTASGTAYYNYKVVKQIISENRQITDTLMPGAAAQLDTAVSAVSNNNAAAAYTTLCNMFFRYFGDIKCVRFVRNGKAVQREYVMKGAAPKRSAPKNTATVQGTAAVAEHTIYSWNKSLPQKVSDDVDITEVSSKAACSYQITVKDPTCIGKGITTKTCKVCGAVIKTEKPALGHDWGEWTETMPPTCAVNGEQKRSCNRCQKQETQAVAALGHVYETVTTKATLKKNGSVVTKCTRCGDLPSSTSIARPKTFTLSKKKYVYNGKKRKPTVTVKDANGNVIDKKYYTVKYAKNRKVGKAVVKVVFKGKYSGTKKLYFTIKPSAAKLTALESTKNTVTAHWKPKMKQTSGYIVQYSRKKNFSKCDRIQVKNYKKSKAILKELRKNTTYYVRIRCYKVVKGKTYYSKWSKVKQIKTKAK